MQSMTIPLDKSQITNLLMGKRLTVTFTASAGRGPGLKSQIKTRWSKTLARKPDAVEFVIAKEKFPEFQRSVKELNEQLRHDGQQRSNLKKVSVSGPVMKFYVKRGFPKLNRLIEKFGKITTSV